MLPEYFRMLSNPIGTIAGVIVCYKLSSARLRQQSARPNANSR
jgi:hypothetical protein